MTATVHDDEHMRGVPDLVRDNEEVGNGISRIPRLIKGVAPSGDRHGQSPQRRARRPMTGALGVRRRGHPAALWE